jgi:hypothetical protein
MNRRITSSISLSVLLSLTSTGHVHAADASQQGPQQINGEYRVVINQTCVRTPFQPPPANGFDPATKQLLQEGESITALGKGLLRLDNNGSAELTEGSQTEVSFPSLAPGKTPVTPPADFTCSGTYTLDSGKMVLTLPSCNVRVPEPNITVTVGPQHFEGHVGQNRKTISLTNMAGELQSITVSAFGNPVQQRQRICTQHALLTR